MVTRAKTASKPRAAKSRSRKSSAKSAKGTNKRSSIGRAVGKQLVIVESPAKARTIAGYLKGSMRTTDFVARIGGEEFVIILPGPPGRVPGRWQSDAVRHWSWQRGTNDRLR